MDDYMTQTASDNMAGQLRGGEAASMSHRTEDMVEIISAYNEVTARLEQSHAHLSGEVVRLQQELASANSALQRSRRLAALGEMAAGIAHEIRNPLSSIQLYAGMLVKDLTAQPEQGEIAGRIVQAVRGLDMIVTDVLNFAKEIKVRVSRLSAKALVDSAVESLGPMIDNAGVVVDTHGIDAEEILQVDVELFRRVFVNLIRNGVEAMPGGGEMSLSVVTTDIGSEIIFRDTGSGIADEAIDRIFNPFFTTRQTGTGLGLAIVHRIIDAHGGAIVVHNDSGAVFTITLPVQQIVNGGSSETHEMEMPVQSDGDRYCPEEK